MNKRNPKVRKANQRHGEYIRGAAYWGVSETFLRELWDAYMAGDRHDTLTHRFKGRIRARIQPPCWQNLILEWIGLGLPIELDAWRKMRAQLNYAHREAARLLSVPAWACVWAAYRALGIIAPTNTGPKPATYFDPKAIERLRETLEARVGPAELARRGSRWRELSERQRELASTLQSTTLKDEHLERANHHGYIPPKNPKGSPK